MKSSKQHCDNVYFQRALDMEAEGFFGLTPQEKYDREVAIVFNSLKKIGQDLPKNARVLDVACGTGETSIRMRDMDYVVDALDASPCLLREARKKFKERVHFLRGNMKYPKDSMRVDKRYNLITCFGKSFGYLETYEEYILMLHNWFSILKPDGVVALEWIQEVRKPIYQPHDVQRKSNITTAYWDKRRHAIIDIEKGDLLYYDRYRKPFRFAYPSLKFRRPIFKYYNSRYYKKNIHDRTAYVFPPSLFLDILEYENFFFIKQMFTEAGYSHVLIMKDAKPLSRDGARSVFVILALKKQTKGVKKQFSFFINNAILYKCINNFD